MARWRVTVEEKDSRRGQFTGPLIDVPCALGRAGCTGLDEKSEGDGKTPLGTYPLRRVFYRPDRLSEPICILPVVPLSPTLGWCDDVGHAAYNQLVAIPFSASHEKMWRDDRLYDVVLVIGHNDAPIVPGAGSAIFVHVAKPGYPPTEGCVAMDRPALLSFLRQIREDDQIQIG